MNNTEINPTTAKSNGLDSENVNVLASTTPIKCSEKDRGFNLYFKVKDPIIETGETFNNFEICVWHNRGQYILYTNACNIVNMGSYTTTSEFIMSSAPYRQYISLSDVTKQNRYSKKKLDLLKAAILTGLIDINKFVNALCKNNIREWQSEASLLSQVIK